jgi:hypothetical protein
LADEIEKPVPSWNITTRCRLANADHPKRLTHQQLRCRAGWGMAVAELISIHRLEVYGMAMFDRTQIYISIAILALIEIAAVVVSAASH